MKSGEESQEDRGISSKDHRSRSGTSEFGHASGDQPQ
jgi:hypothetical protein